MSELGTRLKTAREEKGYSLDELQKITKIQKRYLTAIEAGDFSKMPGEFYARAFVKSYCEAVSLDPDMIFEEHKDELPQPKREPAQLPPRVSRSKPKSVRKKSKMASVLPTLIAIIFIIAIGLAVWILRQGDTDDSAGVSRNNNQGSDIQITENDDTNSNEDDNRNSSSDDENDPESDEDNGDEDSEDEDSGDNDSNNEDSDEEESDEQSLSFAESDRNRYTYTLKDADAFNVDMEFTGDSWVQIYDTDDEEIHGQGYSSGDEAEFDFKDESRIRLNIGDVRDTEIFVNDEQLEYETDDHHQHIIIEYDE